MDRRKSNTGVRKRAPNACSRCRKQKIKCTGSLPCDQCNKRNLACDFDDQSQKILVTRSFINNLQRRIASLEQSHNQPFPPTESVDGSEDNFVTGESIQNQVGDRPSSSHLPQNDQSQQRNEIIPTTEPVEGPSDGLGRSGTYQPSSRNSPAPQLLNPLALGYSAYIADHAGKTIYLGTSSNWAFCRRVLAMTHERVFQVPPPSETLLYEGQVYELGWSDQIMLSPAPELDPGTLPSSDFATYLIDAVKFHCSQFHLFDEDSFMRHFEDFHDPSVDKSSISELWFVHYLILIAFGKAFVVKMNKGGKPPGTELFIQAMKLLPNVTLLCRDPVGTVELLCCAALYSQSLDFRSLAYRLIGQALRTALSNGMHTSMVSNHVDTRYVERCRKAWWTTYLLDRQMSSLMGVPMAIRDEDISAELPDLSGSSHKVKALDLHVKLSRVIAQIFNTIYGAEVNMDKRFVLNIKAVLKSIALVTDELNHSFPISTTGSMAGVTRHSAYLHLLQHQCILLATRPLLFTFLDMRLHSPDITRSPVPRRGTVRALLHMCIEPAQQILKILSGLQEQSLLESFLPFDLDPTFTSTIVLLMAEAVDPKLLDDHSPWTQMAFTILDEMICRGNLIAAFLKSELQQLEVILKHLPPITSHARDIVDNSRPGLSSQVEAHQPGLQAVTTDDPDAASQTLVDYPSMSDDFSIPDVDWHAGVNTEHLMMVADSLDLDGFNWLPPNFMDVPSMTHEQ